MIIFVKIMYVIFEENGKIEWNDEYLLHHDYSEDEHEYEHDATYEMQCEVNRVYKGTNYCCLKCKETMLTKDDLLDLSNVECLEHLFSYAYNLVDIDISGINVEKAISLKSMFDCSSLERLNMSGMKYGNIRDMQDMFCCCESLTQLILPSSEYDLRNFMKNVESMKFMFCCCYSLASLDLSMYTVENVKNMEKMFFYCQSLVHLKLFPVIGVKKVKYMFSRCTSLSHLDLSEFYLKDCEVYNMLSYVNVDYVNLYNCEALDNSLLIESRIKHVYSSYLRNMMNIDYKYDSVYGMYKCI